MKILIIKIFIYIDDLHCDFNIENTLYSKIDFVCNSNNIDEIYSKLLTEIDTLFLTLHSKYNLYSPIVLKSLNYINESYTDEISLKAFTKENKINSSYFGRKFCNEVGMSFSNYLNKKRIYKARELILKTDLSIKEISFKVGYLDTSHFYKNFKKYLGISPAKYRYL